MPGNASPGGPAPRADCASRCSRQADALRRRRPHQAVDGETAAGAAKTEGDQNQYHASYLTLHPLHQGLIFTSCYIPFINIGGIEDILPVTERLVILIYSHPFNW